MLFQCVNVWNFRGARKARYKITRKKHILLYELCFAQCYQYGLVCMHVFKENRISNEEMEKTAPNVMVLAARNSVGHMR